MLIKKQKARMKVNSKECIVWEYNIPSKKISTAIALVNGRYPKQGWSVNKKVEEVYVVISGRGKVVTLEGEFSIKAGDVYYFDKGEKYWVKGERLRVAVVNAPAWSLDQYQVIKEIKKIT